MQAKGTKKREAVSIPLRGDLADDLQMWLESKQHAIAGVVSLKMQTLPIDSPLGSTLGVAPQTAQQAMRHSMINQTTNIYTDPRLLDVAGAFELLPLSGSTPSEQEEQRATGTDGGKLKFAPMVAPATDVWAQIESIRDNNAVCGDPSTDGPKHEKSPRNVGVSRALF